MTEQPPHVKRPPQISLYPIEEAPDDQPILAWIHYDNDWHAYIAFQSETGAWFEQEENYLIRPTHFSYLELETEPQLWDDASVGTSDNDETPVMFAKYANHARKRKQEGSKSVTFSIDFVIQLFDLLAEICRHLQKRLTSLTPTDAASCSSDAG